MAAQKFQMFQIKKLNTKLEKRRKKNNNILQHFIKQTNPIPWLLEKLQYQSTADVHILFDFYLGKNYFGVINSKTGKDHNFSQILSIPCSQKLHNFMQITFSCVVHKIEFSKRCNTKGRTKKKHLKKLLQQSSFYSLCIETINLFGDDSTAFIDILKHICLSSFL